MEVGKVVIGIDLNTKGFDLQIKATKEELDGLIEEYKLLEKADVGSEEKAKGLMQLQKQIEKTRNKYVELKQKQDDLSKDNYSQMKNNLNGVGGSIEKVVKKVAKWSLAVFGVRSAYMFIRQAVSTLSGENEQLAADIDNIRYALASTLQPVIEGLIGLAYKLLSYLAYIIHAWTGRNIFENANKGLKKAVGSAKELQKTLAGFDEMNVLSDSSSSGGGAAAPSFDLSNWQNMEIPNWVKWIADHKDLFKMLAEILLIAFSASTISKVLSNIGMLFGISGGMGLIGLMEILLAIAAPVLVVIAVKGVAEAINEMNLFTEAVEKNTQISDQNKQKHEELTQSIIDKTKANQLDDKQTQLTIDWLKRHVEQNNAMNYTLEEQKNWLGDLNGSNKELKIQQENLRDETIKDIDTWNELTKAGKTTKEEQQKFNETIWDTIQKLDKAGINTDELKRKYESLTGPKYVLSLDVNTSEAERKMNDFVSKVSRFNINGNFSASAGYGGGGGGGRGFAKGGMVYHGLPKLAPGGIINQPGRGVPLGSAIGGERGAEGVIPLTDSQQMMLLGEAIGKYITINANITNTMNGRVISRELQKVQNENDFAYNR